MSEGKWVSKENLQTFWQMIRSNLASFVTEDVNNVLPTIVPEELNKVLPTMVGEQIDNQFGDDIGDNVTSWLTEHVNPAGSAVVVDDTLSIEGAAADAKKTGDEISGLKEDLYEVVSFPTVNYDEAVSYSCPVTAISDRLVWLIDLPDIRPGAKLYWNIDSIVADVHSTDFTKLTIRAVQYNASGTVLSRVTYPNNLVINTNATRVHFSIFYSKNATTGESGSTFAETFHVKFQASYDSNGLVTNLADDIRIPQLDKYNMPYDIAGKGYYQMPTSDFAHQRFNLVDGEIKCYSAMYRVGVTNSITLDYDVQIKIIDPAYGVYGYQFYEDEWHYFKSIFTESPVITAGTEFLFTIKKIDEDQSETADIPTFVSKVEFLTGFVIDINSNTNSIRSVNEEAINKIYSSRWLRNATAVPLSLLWFSDIHRWEIPLDRIIEMKNYLTSAGIVDDSIVTGDVVRNSIAEGSTFTNYWNVPGTEDIMIALGNHDHYLQSATPHGLATFAELDALFFGTVTDWGVVRSGNNPYYYKDYTEQGIRLIVVDCMVYDNDATTEMSWFESVLADAKTNGLAVVIASHYLVINNDTDVKNVTIYDNNWSNNLAREVGTDTMSYENSTVDVVSKVDAFITNGGKFLCYIIGHTHTDIVSCPTGHPEQLIINVASAAYDRGHETQLTTNDLPRFADSRTMDCFNVITFDAENMLIKCVRIGANINMYQQPRTAFAYNVQTHQFINLI